MSLLNQFYLVLFALAITFTQDTLDFKKYSGNFESEVNQMSLTIDHKRDSLFAQVSGNPQFQIFSKKGHEFFGKAIEITFKFQVENDIVSGVTAERFGQKFVFKKLP